jgi:hypothetical protein
MRVLPWKTIFASTGLFLIAVLFFLFGIQQLISQSVGSWTDDLTGTGVQEGAGGTVYTQIFVEDVGNIAIRMRLPKEPRYARGAPLVVSVPSFFSPDQKTFEELSGLSDYGFAQVSFLLSGRKDRETDLASEGEVDYGGAASVAALREVLLFASGGKADIEGNFIQETTTVVLDTDVMGTYAYGHSGILLFQTLAQYGATLSVDFVVGRENPTEPALSAFEMGYFEKGEGILNTLYTPLTDYHDDGITLSYAKIAWDSQDERPYFDVNGDNRARSEDDVLFGSQMPGMFGKRLYSPQLLEALRAHELFTDVTWPQDLATPEEAALWWQGRESLSIFDDVARAMPNLHVMLVFGKKDHEQPTVDKPHIRQAYAGLTAGGLWVRLNPDTSYVAAFDTQLANDYYEHAAGTGPTSWESDAVSWAHPDGAGAVRVIPFAAIAEMSDRVAAVRWDEDLAQILLP